MKKLNILLQPIIIFIVGFITCYLITNNIYSKSQAYSILSKKGVVIADGDELDYYSNTYISTPLEFEAINFIAKDFKKVMMYNADPIHEEQ